MLAANVKKFRKSIKTSETPIDSLLCFMKNVEDSSLVNAGLGSNLNSEGGLEMDASLVITGLTTNMGIVSGISGIQNPLEVCKKMIEET